MWFKRNSLKLERQPQWQLNIPAEKALDTLPSLQHSLQFLEDPQLAIDENQWRNVIWQILNDLKIKQSLSENALDLDPENIKIELLEHEQDYVYLFKCEIQDKNANPVYQLTFEIENDPYVKVPNLRYHKKITYNKKIKRLILNETLNYDSLGEGEQIIKLHNINFIAYSENIKNELPSLYNRAQLSLWQDSPEFKQIIGGGHQLEKLKKQVMSEKESLQILEKKLWLEQLETKKKLEKEFFNKLQKTNKIGKSLYKLGESILLGSNRCAPWRGEAEGA